MRRMLGWVLIVAATAGLFPLLTQVSALQQGQVNTPASDPAVYSISAANSLVHCAVPSTITLQSGVGSTGAYFQCTNSYGSSLTLTWSVQDDGGGGFLSASGSDILPADGVAACRDVTLTPGTTEATRTVVFRGKTSDSAGFYVELYFTGQVTVQAGSTGLGGGCP
ncbi:MAG: hypothetical protein ACOY94_02415 [Bacillota bacterium]